MPIVLFDRDRKNIVIDGVEGASLNAIAGSRPVSCCPANVIQYLETGDMSTFSFEAGNLRVAMENFKNTTGRSGDELLDILTREGSVAW